MKLSKLIRHIRQALPIERVTAKGKLKRVKKSDILKLIKRKR